MEVRESEIWHYLTKASPLSKLKDPWKIVVVMETFVAFSEILLSFFLSWLLQPFFFKIPATSAPRDTFCLFPRNLLYVPQLPSLLLLFSPTSISRQEFFFSQCLLHFNKKLLGEQIYFCQEWWLEGKMFPCFSVHGIFWQKYPQMLLWSLGPWTSMLLSITMVNI